MMRADPRPTRCRGRVGWLVAATLLVALGIASSGARTLGARQPQAGHRIVSLVPSATEMLFAIGAGDEVVGVSSFDRFPPEVASRPKVGALVDPDFERILALRPDLVILYGSQDELMRRLDRASISYYTYRHAGLDGITTTIRSLGERLDHAAEANRVADDIEVGIREVRASVAGLPRPKTALIFGREAGELRGIYASAGFGFLHDILDVAGGADVFGDIQRESVQASVEMLLARAPEVIVELRTVESWSPDRLEEERAVWRRLPSVPAVRSNRIFLLTDDSLSVPGPRVVQSARALAAVIH